MRKQNLQGLVVYQIQIYRRLSKGRKLVLSPQIPNLSNWVDMRPFNGLREHWRGSRFGSRRDEMGIIYIFGDQE